jgi:hypothetical protein
MMKPNEAWLEFVTATKCEDNPHARNYFLAGFQAGAQFIEDGVRLARDFAIEEIHRTILAFEKKPHKDDVQ